MGSQGRTVGTTGHTLSVWALEMYVGLAPLYLLFLQDVLANTQPASPDGFFLHWVTDTTMEIQFPDNTTSTIALSQEDKPDPNNPCLFTGRLEEDDSSKITVLGCRDSQETLVTITSSKIHGEMVDLSLKDGVTHRLEEEGQDQGPGLRRGMSRSSGTAVIREHGKFGSWASWAYCPRGSYVYGYRLRIEEEQGSGDDTALNDIELFCRRPNSNSVTRTIWSGYMMWGSFTSRYYCSGSNNPMVGFSVRDEEIQWWGDDTCFNSVEMVCHSGQALLAHKGYWGDWHQRKYCPPGTAVSGIQTRVERNQGSGDDTAVNGMALYCSRYPGF